MGNEPQIIVSGQHLSKSFYGNAVLHDVTINCKKGIVLALVGENGAGKSTLMNIISGGLEPDSGKIEFEGREVVFRNSHDAQRMGIAFVHQELSLFPELTVGENIMLGREARKMGLIDGKKTHELAEAVLRDIGYQVDVFKQIEKATPAERQITEIAKAWVTKPKVLILDEPTSSLNKAECDKLFAFLNRVKENGISVILITHRMDEIFEVCDEAIILKDGHMTATEKTCDVTKDDLIRQMVGREIKETFPPRCEKLSENVVMELKNASVGEKVQGISLKVPAGSVIGIGGLEGQGQREVARALFGIEPFTEGSYLLKGEEVRIKSPAQAMEHRIGYVPDDRKNDGLALSLSVQENLTLLILRQISRYGVIDPKKLSEETEKGIGELHVKTASRYQNVIHLSGGNQQKIVFSKWTKIDPELLILHEPTRGVDVSSKLEIYELIRSLTKKGTSVVLFSSDMLELIGLSDQIYVMYEGRIMGDISGKDATEEKVMNLSSGIIPDSIQN